VLTPTVNTGDNRFDLDLTIAVLHQVLRIAAPHLTHAA
jgi:hypothetical protein